MAISAGRFRNGNFNRRSTSQGMPRSNKGTSLRELQLQAQLAGVMSDRVTDANDLFGLARVDSSGYTVIPDYLEPIGDSGFYVTPNEPVDPQDCERYPNSPWCGGGLTLDGTGDLGIDTPVAGIGLSDIVTNGSETCVTVDLSLFLLPIAPYTACYRNPSARPLPNRPEPPEPPETEGEPPQFFAFDVPGGNPACTYEIQYQHTVGTTQGWQLFTTFPNRTALVLGWYVWAGFRAGQGRRWHTWLVVQDSRGTRIGQYVNFPYSDNPQNPASVPPIIYRVYPVGSCEPLPPFDPAPPYPPDNGEPPMCNCQETQDLLRLIARRLGTDSYPVTVPASLVDDTDSTEEQQSLTELTAWTIRQMDALIGQFPIEIEIKDADPSQSGDQARKVTIPNIAEGMAELLGLNIKTSVNSDIHTSFLMRLAAEVIATKNASLVTQDYAKANASYLGYKGNTVQRKVNYAFNVTKLDRLESILSESAKSIIGWQDEDKNTVQAYLEKLMFAAGIIKQAFFRPNSEQDKLLNQISNVLGLGQDDEVVEENWREFLKAINNPENPFNLNSPIIPKVTDSDIDLSEENS